MQKLLVLLFVFAALAFAGCVAQQTAPTPVPTAIATPTPTLEATSTPTPEPSPEPTATPEPTISEVKDSVESALEDVFGKDFVFSSDTNPVNGLVSYFSASESNYYDIRVNVDNAAFSKWPPALTLEEKEGESGVKKTIAFTQTSPSQPLVQTDIQMECSNFKQLITITLKEQNTGVLPFRNLAQNMTAKLIDACP